MTVEIKTVADKDDTSISSLLTELKTEAVAFLAADAGARKAWYTKTARICLSEASARGVVAAYSDAAKKADFKGTVGTTAVELMPKAIQRKMDGTRGAQMNFWLYIGGAYTKDYNMHVSVVSLEHAYYQQLITAAAGDPEVALVKDADFVLQPRAADRQAKLLAAAKRTEKSWADLATK